VFTLPDPIEKDLYLICTGTGVAPFRSMLHHIAIHNIPHRDIYLIFGTRKRENLLYYDELRELTDRVEHLHYIPTLSREEWEGKSGYVHQVYCDLISEKNKQASSEERCPASFYLCGWKDMIDEAKKRILEMGYDRK
jgi:CDP-4-dehydro-6-deoxyglucose reductase